MTLAEELSQYSLSVSYKDLNERVVLEAKRRLIDSIGCAIGAFKEEPVKAARSLVKDEYPGRSSTVLGTAIRTSPDMATFVNGTMTRYFDYNDTYLSKEPAHPSDNIAACLAAAERAGVGGKELLLGMAIAYEIQCRLCDAADIRHRGWDHVCYGLVSSALGAGKILELTQVQLTNAVNISLNAHIAMRQVRAGELSEWKGSSFANAARNAVFSAMLARRGMTGPSPIFEGEMGFFKQVSGPFELKINEFGGRNGSFKLAETYLKYFPAEYHAQTAIWAALQARKRVKQIGDIASIEVDTHEAGYTILSKDKEKWTPSTKETADHSLPYMVAMAVLKGKIDNSTYSPKNFRDRKILDFVAKVEVKEDEALTNLYPRHIANRVTLRMRNGGKVSEEVYDPRGHPNNPMTDEEVETKFRGLTSGFLRKSQADAVLKFVWGIDDERELGRLFKLCVVG